MKLESFEEWFAIRPNHSDEGDLPPGRLTFDLRKGISLETIWFLESGKHQHGSFVGGQTITGWLDYQRPATLIQPWLQSSGGFNMGVNTPVMRERQRFVASGIIKNVFLEDINAAIFTGLTVEHPAFHAWVNPGLVNRGWSLPDGGKHPVLSVDILPPNERAFTLSDGTRVSVISTTRASGGDVTKVEEYTVLKLQFPDPVNFDFINRMAWRVTSLFEFLVGARVQAPVYYMPTTQKRVWNDQEQEVVAEYWYRPISRKKRQDTLPQLCDRLTLEKRSPASLEVFLNKIMGGSDELIFLADQIQSVEDYDISITQGYIELLGCLEAFDERTFGSGADRNFQSQMKSLEALVGVHGLVEDKVFFGRIKGFAANKFSLLKRLERLHGMWMQDGFRGAPDLKKIRDLRNKVPHGQGLEVSSDVARDMITYLSYLTALGRYHVLKVLGFSADEIGTAFLRQVHRYGLFVPERLLL